MKNKNLDSVRAYKAPSVFRRKPAPKIFKMDDITWRQKSPTLSRQATHQFQKASTWKFRPFFQFKIQAFAAALALLIAFGGGAWAALQSRETSADIKPQVLGASTQRGSTVIPIEGAGNLGPINSIPNEVLFNMTIAQVESYLAEKFKSPEMKEGEILATREAKLKEYLYAKKSPLSEIADTISKLKHWKFVLAISNSESSLGKRCFENNCSGIGVEPGHPLWRAYETKADWAKDLDRLIERRYKDWTLEQMNGVYNQPGSNNWLMAAKQILEDLEELNIQ